MQEKMHCMNITNTMVMSREDILNHSNSALNWIFCCFKPKCIVVKALASRAVNFTDYLSSKTFS